MQRRSFIEMFVAGSLGFAGMSNLETTGGDKLWNKIKKQFPDASSKVLNLNNGSAGMVPKGVENQLEKLNKVMNRMAPYEALNLWTSIIEESRKSLAQIIDADAKEIALVRNTTEALNYVLRGISVPENSTVICAEHDYGHAINILKRLSTEQNFKLVVVDINLPASNQDIVDVYSEKIDDQCSLVLMTAMTHREGQIMPIKEISKIAKGRGALVVVDAAHAIGHFEHSVKDWDCDYYCTSLHKWLSAPLGSGLLYMKEELISKTQGSYSADKHLDHKMLKFEDVGTKPFSIESSILSAIHFQNQIGIKEKHQRFRDLTDYWTNGVKDLSDIITYKPENYGAICAFHHPKSSTLVLNHFEKKNIHIKKVSSKSYDANAITRYRVSPNIYHDLNDMDRLIDAIKTL